MSIYSCANTNWRYEETNSALHGWLVKNGFRKRGTKDKNVYYSHTAYNGFNIAVPNDRVQLEHLYLAIAQDLHPHLYEGRRHLSPRLDCLNQLAGVVFCAFFEFDPPEGWVWTRDEIIQIGRCVQQAFIMFGFQRMLHACPIFGCGVGVGVGGDRDPECVMPQRLVPQTQLYISTKADSSTGLHMVMPEIRLDVGRLKRVREALLFILQRDGPKLPAHLEGTKGSTWGAIVDELVSNKAHNVHMRMNFAAKCSSCVCKSNKIPLDRCQNIDDPHAPCRGGYVFQPSFYHVTDVLGTNGEPDAFDTAYCMKETGVVYQLRRTSIRPIDESMDKEFYIPPEAPCVPLRSAPREGTPAAAHKRRAEDASVDVQTRRDAAAKSKLWRTDTPAKVIELNKDNPLWLTIQRTVQQGHPLWRQLMVKRISYVIPAPGAYATFWVRVEGMGVHQCMNRQPDEHGNRCHEKAKIWFEITPNGVVQRCGGSNETQKLTATLVACNKFRSSPSRIPLDVTQMIYPDMFNAPSTSPSPSPSPSPPTAVIIPPPVAAPVVVVAAPVAVPAQVMASHIIPPANNFPQQDYLQNFVLDTIQLAGTKGVEDMIVAAAAATKSKKGNGKRNKRPPPSSMPRFLQTATAPAFCN